MSAPDRHRLPSSHQVFDAQCALDALDEPICIVNTAWRLLYMNRAFADIAAGSRDAAPLHDLREMFTTLDNLGDVDLASLSIDDECRWCIDPSGEHSRALDVTARRMRDGAVLIHLRSVNDSASIVRALGERDEENDALREVATALAQEADIGPLLRVICEQAAAQCDASGATVVRVSHTTGHIVSASGALTGMQETSFPLTGSLTQRVIRARSTLRADDYRADHPSFQRVAEQFEIGPALFAPLIAHGEALGAITVARRRGAPPFSTREERRISAIADYAALALWKAHLTEEARAANKAKGDFIATMSHELRTPLTALLGYEELFAEHIFGPLTDQQEVAVDRMRASTQHLQSIIDEVLTFSRLEAGEERARARKTTIREILHGVIAVLEPLARAKGIELIVPDADDPAELRTDPDIVRRILVNLGGNAVKFTERGNVTITVSREATVLRFAIMDTGIGIPQHDMGRLFQPFTQLDSGFTRRFGGTGLGLFVAQRLAALVSGDIQATSTEGVGSTFSLALPIEPSVRNAQRANP